MLRTVEALVEPDGQVRLLEPIEVTETRRAIVTVLDDVIFDDDEEDENDISLAILSEEALSDWNSEEEEAAWAHLQPEQ